MRHLPAMLRIALQAGLLAGHRADATWIYYTNNTNLR